MICILRMQGADIEGWIIATDVPDARRQAQAAWQSDLAALLYRMEFAPTPGKHKLDTGHVMLVS